MPQLPTISDADIETIGDRDIEGAVPQIAPVPEPMSYGQQAKANAMDFGGGLISGAVQSWNPIEIGKSLVRPDIAMEQQMQQGEDAFRQGKPIQGALRTAAASVPWVGPAAAGLADTAMQYATSDNSRQMGEAVGGVLGMGAMAAATPALGRAVGEKFSPYQMTTKRAQKSMEHLTRALAVPEKEAVRFMAGLKEGMPHIYEFSKREGRGWDSVKGFAQTARDASNDYYQKHYSNLSAAFNDIKAKGAPIAQSIREIKANLRPEQAKLRQSIDKLAGQYGGKEFSVEQLETFRKSLNGELEGMEAMHNLDRARLVKSNPAAAAMERQQKSIRRLINTTLDDASGRYEGTTAGVLRTYRSMVDVAERAERRAPSVALAEMERGGKRFGPESLVSPIRAVTLRQANPIGAAAGETAVRSETLLNRPDRLVQRSRHLLDKRGIAPAGSRALAQPIAPKARPPTQGQTVPIQVSPVPKPVSGGGIERRTAPRNPGDDQAFAQMLQQMQSIIAAPTTSPAMVAETLADMTKLLERRPWLAREDPRLAMLARAEQEAAQAAAEKGAGTRGAGFSQEERNRFLEKTQAPTRREQFWAKRREGGPRQ
jgi:hypothetical protein